MSELHEEEMLRAGGGTPPQKLAAAIAHAIYDSGSVKIRAIGAGAVSQAMKAIAIASGYTAPRGITIVCVPGFTSIDGEGGKKISAMVIKVMSV